MSDPGLTELETEDGREWLIREEPLLVDVDGSSVLTLRTPGEDEALALGFLLGEGVIGSLDEVRSVARVPALAERPEAAVDVVRVSLVDPSKARLAKSVLSRAQEIRASCGLCGRTSAEGLTQGLAPLVEGSPRVARHALAAMAKTLRAAQPRFEKTGGCHAAGVFTPGGDLLAVAEDVGRHNALDKAIGLAAQRGVDLRASVLILSGRGGFELLLKALRVGVAVTASVSAASSLAVAIAEEAGATLVGFVREGKPPRVYADSGRLR